MTEFSAIPLVFAALAVVFILLAVNENRKSANRNGVAFRTRLRVGLIFAAASVYIFFIQSRLP